MSLVAYVFNTDSSNESVAIVLHMPQPCSLEQFNVLSILFPNVWRSFWVLVWHPVVAAIKQVAFSDMMDLETIWQDYRVSGCRFIQVADLYALNFKNLCCLVNDNLHVTTCPMVTFVLNITNIYKFPFLSWAVVIKYELLA